METKDLKEKKYLRLRDKLYGENAMFMESMLKVVRTVSIPRDLFLSRGGTGGEGDLEG